MRPPLPWDRDPCPPEPFVLAGRTAHPRGVPPGPPRLLGDVVVLSGDLTPARRALALALAVGAGHGVLVRATAAWVWTGAPDLLPTRPAVAVPHRSPPLPGRRAGGALAVARTRWTAGATWTLLGDVAVTGPGVTAADCARLLPVATARRCLQALADGPGLDVDRLLADLHRDGHRPGTRQAVRLVSEVRDGVDPSGGRSLADGRPPADGRSGPGRTGQPSTTSRCTPLVTR